MMTKRYFSIQELAKITGISTSKLRYVEKQTNDFTVNKIRNRRYYSIDDIAKLLACREFNLSIEEFKQKLQNLSPIKQKQKPPRKEQSTPSLPASATPLIDNNINSGIVRDIDALLAKFNHIANKSFG